MLAQALGKTDLLKPRFETQEDIKFRSSGEYTFESTSYGIIRVVECLSEQLCLLRALNA